MKQPSNTDYVILQNDNEPAKFSNGDIVIYGTKQDAENHLSSIWDKKVIKVTELINYNESEYNRLVKQINKNLI